jgi:hypothetical protein
MAIKTKQYIQPYERMGRPAYALLYDQKGSVIVLVIMILAIMTVIGIVSSDTIVTENTIIRNVGIHKQNTSLVDSALMLGLQRFMQLDTSDGSQFDPALVPWINDVNNDPPSVGDPEEFINTIWYETIFTRRCLVDANNSVDVAAIDPGNLLPLLTTRGEAANGTLRYAVVGWSPVPGMPVNTGSGNPTWKQGRLIAEYVSADAAGDGNGFGLIREEMGLKQQWVP